MNSWDVVWSFGLVAGAIFMILGGLEALGAYFAGVMMILGAWMSSFDRDYLEVEYK